MMTSSATLTISVIDIQDTPPMFVGTPYFGYVYEVSSPVSIKGLNCSQLYLYYSFHNAASQGDITVWLS